MKHKKTFLAELLFNTFVADINSQKGIWQNQKNQNTLQ